MSLLALERVTCRYRSGAHERVVLDAVSLSLDAGELLAVWGLRRSGRSTLLRVAAGIEPPDEGIVRFEGEDLARRGDALGSGIGFCRPGTGDGECAGRRLNELDGGESVRVAIARALALGPLLLVIDEPTKGVDLLERDSILALLRLLADDGIALLVSVGEATALSGADRALSLSDGELRGSLSPELAAVVPLRRRASA